MTKNEKIKVLYIALKKYASWINAIDTVRAMAENDWEDETGSGEYWDLAGRIMVVDLQKKPDPNLQDEIYNLIKYGEHR
ncbi:MAG TPA: hypothetical protein ENJ27_02305 [Candidatus Moranbacteria bacterium]|nr:hypothetical protein [Candidatus Moranbacteria bacterium]